MTPADLTFRDYRLAAITGLATAYQLNPYGGEGLIAVCVKLNPGLVKSFLFGATAFTFCAISHTLAKATQQHTWCWKQRFDSLWITQTCLTMGALCMGNIHCCERLQLAAKIAFIGLWAAHARMITGSPLAPIPLSRLLQDTRGEPGHDAATLESCAAFQKMLEIRPVPRTC